MQSAGLETRDTADLSVSASLRRDRAGAKGEGGEVCATGVAAPLRYALASLRLPLACQRSCVKILPCLLKFRVFRVFRG
jgi:hypothetical protein